MKGKGEIMSSKELTDKEFFRLLNGGDRFLIREDEQGNDVITDDLGFMLTVSEAEKIICALKNYVKENTDEEILCRNKTYCAAKMPSCYEQRYGEKLPGQYETPEYKVIGDTPKKSKTGGYVYLIMEENNGTFKIGMTIDPKNRFKSLKRDVKSNLHIIHIKQMQSAKDMELEEKYWHRVFASKRLHGEWFDLSQQEVEIFINYPF